MPRMQILSTSEQEVFDRPPMFDFRDCKRSFDLPKLLMETASELRSPSSQIGFLLMCAYFKAAQKFYPPQDFHTLDIDAAAKLVGLSGSDFSPTHNIPSRPAHVTGASFWNSTASLPSRNKPRKA